MLWLIACAPKVEFDVNPTSLVFGEVDFGSYQTGEDMPENGWAYGEIQLTNVGKGTTSLSLPEYDTDRLCVAGYEADRTDWPVPLGDIEPEATLKLGVGVCGYEPGELTSEVTTQVDVWTDGDPDTLSISVTFTPVRSDG
jgi:hypothetical protein